LAKYREALELNPQHEDALYYLGNTHLELSHFEEAEQKTCGHNCHENSQTAFKELCSAVPENVVDQSDEEHGKVDWGYSTIDHGLGPLEADIGNNAHHSQRPEE